MASPAELQPCPNKDQGRKADLDTSTPLTVHSSYITPSPSIVPTKSPSAWPQYHYHCKHSHDHAVIADPSGRFERYDQRLGRGAYKKVFVAFDHEQGVEVAWNEIKVDHLRRPDRRKIWSEISILKTLRHDNVINLFHAWTAMNQHGIEYIYFVTELMSSGTLRQFIRKTKGPIKRRVLKNWCMQVLRGLDYLHHYDPPIIHRDLKCDNIFVNGNSGHLKIGDLGLATFKHREHASSVLGTPEYMAPEMYEERYDEKVDSYAFGMCVLEMVTREYPYMECTNPAQIYRRVTAGIPPATLEKVSDDDVRAFIGYCIQSNPDKRPTAAEILAHPFLTTDEPVLVPLPLELGADYLATVECISRKSTRAAESLAAHIAHQPSPPSSEMIASQSAPLPPLPATLDGPPCLSSRSSSTSSVAPQSPDPALKATVLSAKVLEYLKDSQELQLEVQCSIPNEGAQVISFLFHLESDTARSIGTEMVQEGVLSESELVYAERKIGQALRDWAEGELARDPTEHAHLTQYQCFNIHGNFTPTRRPSDSGTDPAAGEPDSMYGSTLGNEAQTTLPKQLATAVSAIDRAMGHGDFSSQGVSEADESLSELELDCGYPIDLSRVIAVPDGAAPGAPAVLPSPSATGPLRPMEATRPPTMPPQASQHRKFPFVPEMHGLQTSKAYLMRRASERTRPNQHRQVAALTDPVHATSTPSSPILGGGHPYAFSSAVAGAPFVTMASLHGCSPPKSAHPGYSPLLPAGHAWAGVGVYAPSSTAPMARSLSREHPLAGATVHGLSQLTLGEPALAHEVTGSDAGYSADESVTNPDPESDEATASVMPSAFEAKGKHEPVPPAYRFQAPLHRGYSPSLAMFTSDSLSQLAESGIAAAHGTATGYATPLAQSYNEAYPEDFGSQLQPTPNPLSSYPPSEGDSGAPNDDPEVVALWRRQQEEAAEMFRNHQKEWNRLLVRRTRPNGDGHHSATAGHQSPPHTS
ncbi:hypothetical protein H4R34_001977 [Dimargaris verticillata]|uniref:Protein kinase domain-containing protein n=1 Tax=Dimargaris verticillata TaxID=2761393 RepID=A0A9W8B4L0_9FUNG|nr:hypothetical protein H4R34_001977 [Dimargaris verticillata]